MSPRLAVRVALKAVDALASAWRQGIVHRDVKPDNLLVTPNGDVKVIDWGMSGNVGEELPASPSADTIRFVGTPAYLPPEMARPGMPFDHRTDMYGLGATIYHAVTGKLPFNYRKPTQMVLAHMNEVPVAGVRSHSRTWHAAAIGSLVENDGEGPRRSLQQSG